MSTSSARQCVGCLLAMDTRATVSSVTVTREYGNITNSECKRFDADAMAVLQKEMSIADFVMGLKNGAYSRPASKTDKGEFCEQITLDSESADKITDMKTLNEAWSKVKGVRIRKVTGGGSFSSHTKAKIKLSLPVRAQYVSEIKDGKPVVKDIIIRGMTLYHPSPVRIENVQHDAVLSLNDPSDEVNGDDTVVLIPLVGANTGANSEAFFNKIVKHITTLYSPDDVTGMFPRIDVPTGSDWSIKDVFWLGPPDGNGYAPVQDSYYSWDGLPTFNREEVSRRNWSQLPPTGAWDSSWSSDGVGEIGFGWKDSGSKVRYFMMGRPVNISSTDLSILTRNLPPTPPEQAIHSIPDATMTKYPEPLGANQPTPAGWPGTPIIYKSAEGKALDGQCCGGRERAPAADEAMTTQPSFEGFTNLAEARAAVNSRVEGAKQIYRRGAAEGFSPSFIMTLVFAFITFIFMAIGAWIALYMIHRDYDYAWTTFSSNAGKVFGAIIKKLSPPSVGLFETVKKSIPKMIDAGVGKAVGGVPGTENALGQGMSLLKGPGGQLSGLLGKLKV
jgi:hypothetical protein